MHFISHVSYKLTKVSLGCASDPVNSRVGLETIIPQNAGNTLDCCRYNRVFMFAKWKKWGHIHWHKPPISCCFSISCTSHLSSVQLCWFLTTILMIYQWRSLEIQRLYRGRCCNCVRDEILMEKTQFICVFFNFSSYTSTDVEVLSEWWHLSFRRKLLQVLMAYELV